MSREGVCLCVRETERGREKRELRKPIFLQGPSQVGARAEMENRTQNAVTAGQIKV